MQSFYKDKKWDFTILRRQFLEGDNRVLLVTWTFVMLLIAGFTISLKSENISFFGIADSYELLVNFEYPVEIKKIHVISGQIVEKNDLLLELSQEDIEHSIRDLELKISQLEAEKELRTDIHNMMGASSHKKTKLDSLSIEILSYKKELEILSNQKNHLLVYAESAGIVGSVNFKSGQKVPPFTTILSVMSEKPRMIKAYIHENIYTKVDVNQKVKLKSISDSRKIFLGTVASVGSRIVEMPERLTNSAVVKIWGREVMIRIDQNNNLLMGEKVLIEPEAEWDTSASKEGRVSVNEDYLTDHIDTIEKN